ncbi:MAG: hypothetical protein Q9M97_06120, partial [Candidatus Gracilibacteria bacterium]|nr:hypothetical protein [Candidatus Gracilibacteria bacterium]
MNDSIKVTTDTYKVYLGDKAYQEKKSYINKRSLDNNNKISDKEYKTSLIVAGGEIEIPFGLYRDAKYNLGLTSNEQSEYENLTKKLYKGFDEIAILRHNFKGTNEDRIKLSQLKYNEKKNIYAQIHFIRLKWERKNICYSPAESIFIKDRDTFKSISLINSQEKADLRNDQYFGRLYGLNLDCRFMKLYPELKITVAELEKMSTSQITKTFIIKIYHLFLQNQIMIILNILHME